MCFARRNLTPKARRFLAIGSVCLTVGLVLSLFDKDFGSHHAAFYDGLRGFLLGLAIVFNFNALRLAGNLPQNQP